MGGSLEDQEYLEIVVFAVRANGVDLSGKSITPDSLVTIGLH